MAVPAAVAAPAVPASMALVAEDPIVGLWRELLAHRAAKVDDKWTSIEAEILQADALTAEGWAIQAEILADHGSSRIDGADERVAGRIAQHLRRMAEAEQLAASGDAKVRTLHAAWQEAQKASKDALDRAQNAKEKGQPNADALWELAEKVVEDEIAAYNRFLTAPARTVPVMLLKFDAWEMFENAENLTSPIKDTDPVDVFSNSGAAALAVMRDLQRLAGRRVITSEADPVLTLCEKHRKAWTLVDGNDPLGGDAFKAVDKIALEIANTTATTINGVLSQARLLSQWDQSTGWRDARMAIIGHFILAGLKFLVRNDYQERDLAGAAVKV